DLLKCSKDSLGRIYSQSNRGTQYGPSTFLLSDQNCENMEKISDKGDKMANEVLDLYRCHARGIDVSGLLCDEDKHLDITIDKVEPEMKVPVDEFDGNVTYGQKRGG
ncbi:DDX1-like protein, partial [Mya arenaria]